MKVINSKEEEIVIRNCRRKGRVGIINGEVKGWTSSLKQQEAPLETTKTKEQIRLKQMKIKVKRSALEWDYFLLQEQFKSLMYIDHSLRGDPRKYKFIGELNFKIAFI